jgi:hypothetical protein
VGDWQLNPEQEGKEPTAGQLARYLFGNPFDPRDSGLIGRLMRQHDDLAEQVKQSNETLREEMRATNRRFGRLMGMGWAVILLLIAAMLSMIGTLIYQIIVAHHP